MSSYKRSLNSPVEFDSSCALTLASKVANRRLGRNIISPEIHCTAEKFLTTNFEFIAELQTGERKSLFIADPSLASQTYFARAVYCPRRNTRAHAKSVCPATLIPRRQGRNHMNVPHGAAIQVRAQLVWFRRLPARRRSNPAGRLAIH